MNPVEVSGQHYPEEEEDCCCEDDADWIASGHRVISSVGVEKGIDGS